MFSCLQASIKMNQKNIANFSMAFTCLLFSFVLIVAFSSNVDAQNSAQEQLCIAAGLSPDCIVSFPKLSLPRLDKVEIADLKCKNIKDGTITTDQEEKTVLKAELVPTEEGGDCIIGKNSFKFNKNLIAYIESQDVFVIKYEGSATIAGEDEFKINPSLKERKVNDFYLERNFVNTLGKNLYIVSGQEKIEVIPLTVGETFFDYYLSQPIEEFVKEARYSLLLAGILGGANVLAKKEIELEKGIFKGKLMLEKKPTIALSTKISKIGSIIIALNQDKYSFAVVKSF